MDELKLGKTGRFGNVNPNELQGGIKKEQMKDAKTQALFDFADANKDGILDANEITAFKESVEEKAGNEKLSGREARKYLKEHGIKKMNKKDLFKFINQISGASENIEASTVDEKGVINIKYKDGLDETINPDKSRVLVKDGMENHYDSENNLQKNVTIAEDGSKVTSEYENGKVVKKTVVKDNFIQTIKYDENENPVSKVEKNGMNVSYYDVADNDFRLTKEVKNKGLATETTTNYEYDEDGSVTANTFNSDNKKVAQSKTIDGKTYNVSYDGEGNTVGIVVQNGESISALAKKFGCSVEDIINANSNLVKGKDSKNPYFLVGEEIKIPRELEADNPALAGRKTKEEAIADYEAFINSRKKGQTPAGGEDFPPTPEKTPEEIAKDNRNEVVQFQKLLLQKAEEDFEAQLKQDGWAGDLADGISILWGSKNRASKVRKDIQQYKEQLEILNEAANENEKWFASKFKEIYGVDYNIDNIRQYAQDPSDENYKKAFGTKNNMSERVAKYNKSQQDGAAAVKTTAVIAGSAAAAIATGGSSLIATAAVVGASTMGTRAIAEISDLATNDIDGDVAVNSEQIARQALQEGLISGATAGILKGIQLKLATPKTTAGSAPKALPPGPETPPPKALPPGPDAVPAKALPPAKEVPVTKALPPHGDTGAAAANTAKTAATGAAALNTAKEAATLKLAETAGYSSVKEFKNAVSAISNKLGKGESLTEAEQKLLATIFNPKNPPKLSDLNRKYYIAQLKNFHPDANKYSEEFANEMTVIINLLKH